MSGVIAMNNAMAKTLDQIAASIPSRMYTADAPGLSEEPINKRS